MKSFKELVEIDLTKYTQKKPTFYRKDGKLVPTNENKWLDYIEWAKVLELLYTVGEASQVSFKSEFNKEKPNTLIISLTIDEKQYFTDYPIIDGNALIENPNQMQLHKAELRGFVKCVAIHTGLGLNLWMKEERELQETVSTTIEKIKPKLENSRLENAKQSIINNQTTFEKINEQFDLTNEQINFLSNVD